MKNLFKRISVYALTLIIVLGAGITLTACIKKDTDETKENQIINLSVNPGIEFIVDNDDKVISVSATNEDGAYILEKFTSFTGMTAQDAAFKFLELAEQYGFVVEGSTNGEIFTISVSGEGAEDLYNDVKNKINQKAIALGLSISQMNKIDEDDLENMVAECYQEYSLIEIDELDEDELINLIKSSREETKDLYTNDEKQAYYRERAQKVISAKIDVINTYLEQNSSLIDSIITPFVDSMNQVYSIIQTEYNSINSQIENLYSSVNGIDDKFEEYVSQKKAYLNAVEEYRTALEQNLANAEELKTSMESIKAQSESTWNEVESARNNATQQLLILVQANIHNELTMLNTQIDTILESINLSITQINSAIQTQINSLKTEYANASVNPWE